MLLALSLLAGCGDKWVVLGEDLDSALLHVRQDDDGSVWAIGADTGDGPAVYVYDGAAWEQLETGDSGDLWWGWGDADAVWMVGEGGRVVRYDRPDGTFETTVLDSNMVFFGIWGTSADDLWVVGGDIDGGTGVQIWTGSLGGTAWTLRPAPPAADAAVAMYKVWGSAADDVWIVGDAGVVLHGSTGDPGSAVDVGTTEPLFTVHGDGDDVVAVGGSVTGVLLEGSGETWTNHTPPTSPRLNGVYVPGDCDPIAVGGLGMIYRRTEGDWIAEKEAVTTRDYHSGLVDDECGAWAVGGNLTSADLDGGVLVYRGPQDVPPL